MTTPIIESFNTGSGSASGSVTLTKPSGLADGDLLVAFLTSHVKLSWGSLPTGWASHINSSGGISNASAPGGSANIFLVYKQIVTASGEPASYTFTDTSGTSTVLGIILRISNYTNTNSSGTTTHGVFGALGSGSKTTPSTIQTGSSITNTPLTAVTSVVTAMDRLAIIGVWAPTTGDITPDAAWTEIAEVHEASGEGLAVYTCPLIVDQVYAAPVIGLPASMVSLYMQTSFAPADYPTPGQGMQQRGSVGTAYTQTSGAALVPALPAGVVQNDILFLLLATRNNDTFVVPSGWTKITWGAVTENNTSALHVEMWWKRAGASESAPSITLTNNAVTVSRGAHLSAARDASVSVDPPFDIIARSNNAASTTVTYPSGTNTHWNDIHVLFVVYAESLSSAGTVTSYAGFQGSPLAGTSDLSMGSMAIRGTQLGVGISIAPAATVATLTAGHAAAVNVGILLSVLPNRLTAKTRTRVAVAN